MNFVKFCVVLFNVILLQTNAQVSRFKFEIFTNQSVKEIHAFEGQKIPVNVSVIISTTNDSLINEEIYLRCRMGYLPVGTIINWTDIVLSTGENRIFDKEFEVIFNAKRLGGSNFNCSIITRNGSLTNNEETVAQLIVSRKQTIAEIIFRVIVITFVIILTFVMGCGLDPQIILGYLKKPVSPFIGFCSQFIFMPLISAGLAKFTKIDNAFGLGLLVIGCSPGGGASNVWTILFGGDLNLSMTMTFISTCAALVMMPLWMFALGRIFIDPRRVVIPYGSIALNLLQMVVPAALGIAFRWISEDKAKSLMRKVKFLGLLFIIFIFTFGTYANFYIYKLFADYPLLLPIGAMLPWLGFLFGFLLALITRRTKAQAIAIALETGFQNIGIAILILKFSMVQPYGDLGSCMPIAVSIFTPFPLYFGLLVKFINKKCFKNQEKDKDLELTSPTDECKEPLTN